MPDKNTDAHTRMLTRASFSVRPGGPRATLTKLILIPAVVLGGLGAFGIANGDISAPGFSADSDAVRLGELAESNARLTRELTELRLQQTHDKAKISSMEAEYARQAEALQEVNRELAFFRKNTPGVRPGKQ